MPWSAGSRRVRTPTTADGRWPSATCRRRWRRPDAAFEVEIIGHRRPARLLTEPVLDPSGSRMPRLRWGGRRTRQRRQVLLDGVVAHLAEHGLADVSLRPMAARLHVSVNALVHHFGPKEDLVVAALDRATEVQLAVRDRWLQQRPDLSAADLLRRWWRWMNAEPANLALVRLGIEAAALDATVSGLPGAVRAEQISTWRADIERRLVADGLSPRGRRRRGVAGEGDVHGPDRRPAGDRAAAAARPGAGGRAGPAGGGPGRPGSTRS